jgi:hypothetical protein
MNAGNVAMTLLAAAPEIKQLTSREFAALYLIMGSVIATHLVNVERTGDFEAPLDEITRQTLLTGFNAYRLIK